MHRRQPPIAAYPAACQPCLTNLRRWRGISEAFITHFRSIDREI
jgi:hypothetical protein